MKFRDTDLGKSEGVFQASQVALVVKNLPANAGEDCSFDPRYRKSPHAAEQPSLCATNTEPALESPRPQLLSPHARSLHFWQVFWIPN